MNKEEFDKMEFCYGMYVQIAYIFWIRIWGVNFDKRTITNRILHHFGIWISYKWIT